MFDLTSSIALTSAPAFSRASTVVVWPPLAAAWRGVLLYCKMASQHFQFVTGGLTNLHVGSGCCWCWFVSVTSFTLLSCTKETVDTYMYCKAVENAKGHTTKTFETHTIELTSSTALMSAPARNRTSAVAVWPPVAVTWRGVLPYCSIESQHCKSVTEGLAISNVWSGCFCCWFASAELFVLLDCTRQTVDTFLYRKAADNIKNHTVRIIATRTFDLTLSAALTSVPSFSRTSAVAVSPPAAATWRGVLPYCKVVLQHCESMTGGLITLDDRFGCFFCWFMSTALSILLESNAAIVMD